MRRAIATAFMLAFVAFTAGRVPVRADGNEPPYLKLAQALGTPNLVESEGPKDKSRLLLHFVPDGEDTKTWTKMTTISILKVPQDDTETATRGVIRDLRDALKARHATIDVFDESPLPPVTCFFEFTAGDEADRGIVYSPDSGFVTVAQFGLRTGHEMDPENLKTLKALIGQ
jgi:hypothetical protein